MKYLHTLFGTPVLGTRWTTCGRWHL